jgi:hypothetical protein
MVNVGDRILTRGSIGLTSASVFAGSDITSRMRGNGTKSAIPNVGDQIYTRGIYGHKSGSTSSIFTTWLYQDTVTGYDTRFNLIDTTSGYEIPGYGICTDGVYFYLCQSTAVLKILMRDMSIADQYNCSAPTAICVNGDYLYISNGTAVFKVDKDTMSLVTSANIADSWYSICSEGDYLYLSKNGGYPWTNGHISKYLCSDLSLVASTSGGIVFYPRAVGTDGTYIYTVGGKLNNADYVNDNLFKFLVSDMSYVGQTAFDIGAAYNMAVKSGKLYVGGYFRHQFYIIKASDLSLLEQYNQGDGGLTYQSVGICILP